MLKCKVKPNVFLNAYNIFQGLVIKCWFFFWVKHCLVNKILKYLSYSILLSNKLRPFLISDFIDITK